MRQYIVIGHKRFNNKGIQLFFPHQNKPLALKKVVTKTTAKLMLGVLGGIMKVIPMIISVKP